MSSTQLKNQHLLWRAGFGPSAEGLNQLSLLPPQDLYAALKHTSSKKPDYLDATDDYFKGLVKGIQEEGVRRQMDKEGAKMMQQQSRKGIKNLNLLWLDETELHGGHMTAASTPGQGTTVTLYIPALGEEAGADGRDT